MNKYVKNVLIGVGAVIALVIIINLLTPRVALPEEIKEMQKRIDSLQKNNLELIKKQIDIDSSNANYEQRISDIESRLLDVGQSKIIIQKIYNDKINKSRNATPSDLDSFFKQRYNY
jgi:hypothetical protein